MSGIIGRKVGMISFTDKNEFILPCTIIESVGCVVVQKKSYEKDGYEAVQLGFGKKKSKNASKSVVGHFNKANCDVKALLREFRNFNKDVNVGDVLKLNDVFSEGDFVDITGTSKGKGFQGVVKRHHFSGVGGASHGQDDRQRAPGSIGGSSYPSRVFKGLRMAGRTGSDTVTVKNLEIIKIYSDKDFMIVKGSVPGCNGGYLFINLNR
jgi:large subunit ribosomal protein L3